MKRSAPVWLALGALQLTLLWIYQYVNAARQPSADLRAELIQGDTTPALFVVDSAGVRSSLVSGRPTLVHFWATWCEPCKREMPLLRAVADALEREGALRLELVAMDKSWTEIRQFFSPEVPRRLSRDDGAAAALGVSRLPATFLLDRDGEPHFRVDGAREWNRANVRTLLKQVEATGVH